MDHGDTVVLDYPGLLKRDNAVAVIFWGMYTECTVYSVLPTIRGKGEREGGRISFGGVRGENRNRNQMLIPSKMKPGGVATH